MEREGVMEREREKRERITRQLTTQISQISLLSWSIPKDEPLSFYKNLPQTLGFPRTEAQRVFTQTQTLNAVRTSPIKSPDSPGSGLYSAIHSPGPGARAQDAARTKTHGPRRCK
ncbi:hypothetical protein WMY93_007379 [Mugilogobius chulae]|uniref:Uncharacterized protein n=1 Tax=Mugilogobius chulae TaxID=88201 RepID=A0AAW0PCT3_9GOBI